MDFQKRLIKQEQDLISSIRELDPNYNETLLERALTFSKKVHENQTRASGEPYFSHLLAVAHILVSLHLDLDSIITGLLHDTVEDTQATLEEIESLFGSHIAKLVDGVTKLNRLEFRSDQQKQAENFRKLVLAMSSDIRVLLVKLADRLHNMRTLHFFSSEEKQKRIAQETLDIYVPLAERMGLQQVKDELEDIAFGVLHPDMRDTILNKREVIYKREGSSIDNIIDELNTILESSNIKAQVQGREKTLYSIWRKMRVKNITFEQISDIMAFRIVVSTIPECYQVLGILHSRYPMITGRFKDYISTPKPNNYRSIHTSVIGPLSQRIEIQIKTFEMHQVAEWGVAAHWCYKQGGSHDGKQYAWLRGLVDILEYSNAPEEFLENTKMEMFKGQVFCFTPTGDLIVLPDGATTIDFAYAIHSEVGNHTISAKINGRQMPLRTPLKNGDQVEIVTAKNQKPSPAWERYVVTGKARACIRKFIRSQQRDQFFLLGRHLISRALKAQKLPYVKSVIEKVTQDFYLDHPDQLLISIGEGIIAVQKVIAAIVNYASSDMPHEEPPLKLSMVEIPEDTGAPIVGLISGMPIHYAGCCHPLPGDPISGVIITGKGIAIHTKDCDVLGLANQARILNLSWDTKQNTHHKFVARITITFTNQPGSLASTTNTISKKGANIINIKVVNRSSDFWDVFYDVEVKDSDHLSNIMAVLRGLSIVTKAERV